MVHRASLSAVMMAILCNGAFATAEDLPAQGSVLERTIEQVEEVDRELAELTKQLKAIRSATERHRVQDQIRQLQSKQEQLIQELERMVGPLPPSVRSEPEIPLEQQMKARERRHETTLESDVGQRLKR
jgi:ribonuclease P protein component